MPVNCDGAINLAKNLVHPFGAANHGVFAGNNTSFGGLRDGNKLGGDVAAANVFFKGEGHGFCDVAL